MPISEERIEEIALFAFQKLKEEEGILLRPKETRREIMNMAKSLGIDPQECAEFALVILKTTYEKVVAELEAIASRRK